MLRYLGGYWGRGKPRFLTPLVVEYTREVIRTGGAVTWDLPAHYDGTLSEPHLDQLRAVAQAFPPGFRGQA